MPKFRISVIDFIPETGKHKIGQKDSSGQELAIGDVVELNGQKYMIVYRYGFYQLKQPMTACTLGISDWSKTTKVNELWSTPDNVICAEQEDPLFEAVKHLLEED